MFVKWKNLLRSCREVKKFLSDEVRERFINLQILLEECGCDKELQFKHAIYTPGKGWEYDPYKVDIEYIEQEIEKRINEKLAKMWNKYDALVKNKRKGEYV